MRTSDLDYQFLIHLRTTKDRYRWDTRERSYFSEFLFQLSPLEHFLQKDWEEFIYGLGLIGTNSD